MVKFGADEGRGSGRVWDGTGLASANQKALLILGS